MWSQLGAISVHQNFSEVMAEVLSVTGLEKYVFTCAVRHFMLIVRLVCLNYYPDLVAVCINS